MATSTILLQLRKPDLTDNVNIVTDLNENMDKIDTYLTNLLIGLGNGSDGTKVGKLDAEFQVYTTNLNANTEDNVTHTLGRIPIGFIIINKDKACDIYKSTTAWSTTNIYLKCTAASSAVTIIIF